jgi:protein-tyrosine-phosphatase
MAEGWSRHLGGDEFSAESAGIEAHGKNPRAIAVMREAGIDISSQESTIVSEEEIMAQFRATRDEVRQRVQGLLKLLSDGDAP